MEKMTFASAISHFANTKGPGGFIWKFMLGFAAVYLVYYAIYLALAAAIVPGGIASVFEPVTTPEGMQQQMMASMGLNLLSFPISLVMYAVFEASVQRRYTRQEGFSFGFGADEFRLIGVYFAWFLLVIVTTIVIGVPTGLIFAGLAAFAQDTPVLLFTVLPIVYIVAMFLFMWVFIRFSPAAAITIRDRKFTFLKARHATKGHFWQMFSANLVLMIGVYFAILVLYLIIIVIGIIFAASSGAFSGAADPDAIEGMIISAMTNPVAWVIAAVVGFLFAMLMGLITFMFMGIPARAAMTDPTWTGSLTAAEVFE